MEILAVVGAASQSVLALTVRITVAVTNSAAPRRGSQAKIRAVRRAKSGGKANLSRAEAICVFVTRVGHGAAVRTAGNVASMVRRAVVHAAVQPRGTLAVVAVRVALAASAGHVATVSKIKRAAEAGRPAVLAAGAVFVRAATTSRQLDQVRAVRKAGCGGPSGTVALAVFTHLGGVQREREGHLPVA